MAIRSSADLPDYYAVLQVHPDADDEVIAAAYRQLMKKYHPDRAGEDPNRMAEHLARSKALNEAFGVSRTTARAALDRDGAIRGPPAGRRAGGRNLDGCAEPLDDRHRDADHRDHHPDAQLDCAPRNASPSPVSSVVVTSLRIAP